MQLYSVIGVFILVGSGIAGAWAMIRKAQASLHQVDALIAFLRYARIEVECFSMPVSQILQRADQSLIEACGCSARGAERLDDFFVRCEISDKEAYDILQKFANDFGKGYREEQLRECDYYLDMLIRRREELAAHLPKKMKLDATLCICLALAVAVLLL